MNTKDQIVLALSTLVGVAAFVAIATAQVPNSIAAPGETVVLKVQAEGAQVYECKANPDAKLGWQFREPIATLIVDGNTVGRHFRHNGAGEMLVFSAADFEDFRQPRPDMPPEMEGDLEEVVRILAENRWPWRLHATYDETISRALDVFERVNRDIPLKRLNWFFDHCETISEKSINRIAALGGGIALQHRMAYQGEYFVERSQSRRSNAAGSENTQEWRQNLSWHRRHACCLI